MRDINSVTVGKTVHIHESVSDLIPLYTGKLDNHVAFRGVLKKNVFTQTAVCSFNFIFNQLQLFFITIERYYVLNFVMIKI